MATLMMKRFIAGVQCPVCGKLDTIRWWQENQCEYAECVECDFSANELEKFDQAPKTLKQKIIWLQKNK